jgi:hypothetical protein
LAERWDGTRWAIQATSNPSNDTNELRGVSCTSAGTCTAVGFYIGARELTLAEEWDGRSWAAQPTPSPGHSDTQLSAVSCPSARACTAVGDGGLIESWTPPSNKFTISRIKTQADGTITFSVSLPNPGSVDVLETAWNDNLGSADVRLKPAPERFVFARPHVLAGNRGSVNVTVTPNQRGKTLVAHHAYRVVLRLWVSYTPHGGVDRTIGFLGLHLPGTCATHNTVTALHARTVIQCK